MAGGRAAAGLRRRTRKKESFRLSRLKEDAVPGGGEFLCLPSGQGLLAGQSLLSACVQMGISRSLPPYMKVCSRRVTLIWSE